MKLLNAKAIAGMMFMRVAIRRWWAPWSWCERTYMREIKGGALYDDSFWMDAVTGEKAGPLSNRLTDLWNAAMLRTRALEARKETAEL